MNHTLNARLHKLPPCPECGAARETPCANERGQIREPHHVRQRIADGELVVARVPPPEPPKPSQRKVASLRMGLRRAVDNAVDNVRREWGVAAKKKGR